MSRLPAFGLIVSQCQSTRARLSLTFSIANSRPQAPVESRPKLLLVQPSSSSSRRTIGTCSMSSNTATPSDTSPIVMFGPSGSGKSTLLKRLQASDDWPKFGFSVSHTTRKPRPGEEPGVAYHFVSRDEFQDMIKADAFIEHAEFGGNCYGTSLKAVSDVSEQQGKRCILDIDAQGVKLILKNHPSLNPLIIFISPPSLEELESRLQARNTESPESLQSRLSMAQSEIDYAKSGVPHLIIVNQDLDQAYKKFHLACTSSKLNNPNQFPESDPIPF